MAQPVYNPDFSLLNDVFVESWVFGLPWILSLALALVSMALISKKPDDWKILGLPIFTLLAIMGMPVGYFILAIASIIFVIETLSIQGIGQILEPITRATGSLVKGTISTSGYAIPRIRRARREKRRELKETAQLREKISTEKVMRKAKLFGILKEETQEPPEIIKGPAPEGKIFGPTPLYEPRTYGPQQRIYGPVRPPKIQISPRTEDSPKPPPKKPTSTTQKRKFQITADKSWEAYKEHGAKEKGTKIGERLTKAMSGLSKKLGRRLTDKEIKELYTKIGKREGRY